MFELSNNTRVDFLVDSFNKDIKELKTAYEHIKTFSRLEHHMTDSRYKMGYVTEGDAIGSLSKSYWNEFYNSFCFRDFLSTKTKNEFDTMLNEHKFPAFTIDNLNATIQSLYSDLGKFFNEKVDSLFIRLSGDHVTNSPSGFSKRMIYKYVWDELFNNIKSSAIDEIHDLRSCIFVILGKPVPTRASTYNLLRCVCETGEWYEFDNNAFKIKVFKNGNAHFEVHPYIAIKLNEFLAKIYPTAIPPKFRTVDKKIKEFEYKQISITGDELIFLRELQTKEHVYSNYLDEYKKNIVYLLGGTIEKKEKMIGYGNKINVYEFKFDYDIKPAIRYIISIGSLSDYVSYQFYPTPSDIATLCGDILCDVDDLKTILEPSAGTGSLVKEIQRSFDAEIDTCEINPLHQIILSGMSNVVCNDFIKLQPTKKYSAVVMNPPYSENRWKDHLIHATKFSDFIVAVLPTGHNSNIIKLTDELGHYDVQKHGEFDNFDKTNIKVSVYVIKKV